MAARIPLGQGRPGPFHRIPIGIGHGNEHDVGVFDAIHALDSATGGFRTEHHASASPVGGAGGGRYRRLAHVPADVRADPERGEPRQSPRPSTSPPGATFATDQTINPDARRHRDARGADCTLGPRWTCPSRSSGTRSTRTNTVGAVAVTPACPHVDRDADAISRPWSSTSMAVICRRVPTTVRLPPPNRLANASLTKAHGPVRRPGGRPRRTLGRPRTGCTGRAGDPPRRSACRWP